MGGGGVVEWKVCCVRCQVGGKISSEVRDDDEVEVKAIVLCLDLPIRV